MAGRARLRLRNSGAASPLCLAFADQPLRELSHPVAPKLWAAQISRPHAPRLASTRAKKCAARPRECAGSSRCSVCPLAQPRLACQSERRPDCSRGRLRRLQDPLHRRHIQGPRASVQDAALSEQQHVAVRTARQAEHHRQHHRLLQRCAFAACAHHLPTGARRANAAARTPAGACFSVRRELPVLRRAPRRARSMRRLSRRSSSRAARTTCTA